MKIVTISDTHMTEPELPKGDILIHAGDMTYRGTPQEIGKQRRYLERQLNTKFKHVIVCPGNHDFGFESEFLKYKDDFENSGLILLNDSGITIEGLNIWGSPITPFFHSWAFNRYRGEDINKHWDLIPDNTNILITHGPPHGILDTVITRERDIVGYDQYYRAKTVVRREYIEHVGCEDLLEKIKRLKELKLHVFGHLHNGYGQEEHFGVKFINAASLDDDYQPAHKPIIVEI